MAVLCVIPARAGSKRLKDKNILDLNGKPVIGYTIEAAKQSNLLDRIVVSTESSEIADIVQDMYGLEVIKRPHEFARDDSPIEEALLHAVEYLRDNQGYQTDIVVWLHANLPVRPEGLIDEVVEKLINSKADSCVTCCEVSEVPEVMKTINEKGRLVPLFKDVGGHTNTGIP